MNPKKLVTISILFVCLYAFSGCKSEKVAYNDFIYDDKVTWSSSYSDIVGFYGEPDNITFYNDSLSGDPIVRLVFDNTSVVGINGFERTIMFHEKTGDIFKIALRYYTENKNDISNIKEYYKKVNDAIQSKYGVATETSGEQSSGLSYCSASWNNIIEDVHVELRYGYISDSGYILLIYESKRKTNKIINSDLPINNATATP